MADSDTYRPQSDVGRARWSSAGVRLNRAFARSFAGAAGRSPQFALQIGRVLGPYLAATAGARGPFPDHYGAWSLALAQPRRLKRSLAQPHPVALHPHRLVWRGCQPASLKAYSSTSSTTPPPHLPACATPIPPESATTTADNVDQPSTDMSQRERSRSPRRGRSRSPNGRRSYSPRDESRNNNHQKRRSRSPMTGQPQQTGQSSNTGYNAPPPHHGSYEDRAARREQVMNNIRETSQQDRRVYVGNLSYDVKWHHLKDFMRQAGEVLYADVLLLPNGMSKGCGIVEYATREQAQHAIATLSNQNLMGRLIYVREDRESEPRFGPPGGIPRGGYSGGMGGGAYGGFNPMGTAGRQLYVSNLPFNIGWQDLKDLFRQAARQGAIIRADVHMGPDGRPKGSGIVVFESPDDARNAIQQFNGYEWNGRIIEVREDRFANPGMGGPGFGRGGYGAPRGGFGYGGRGGFAGRGGYGYGGRGGFGGHGGYDNNVSMPPNPFTDNVVPGTEKCDTIFVRNLPWSTSNEDLVELFQTIGKVEQAEIQYEPSGRSRGTGVVRFDNADTAETAIAKFQGYQYGGRPLNIAYAKYLNPQQNDNAMDTDPHAGLTQDQIM